MIEGHSKFRIAGPQSTLGVTTLDPEKQREFAVEVVEQLRARGFTAYWAGGCVRDQLLGRTPKDYDVATNATPMQIRDVLRRRRTLSMGAAFGVITVLGPRGAGQIEVATFRQDAAYSDGRHPDGIALLERHVRDGTSDAPRIFDLGDAGGAEVHRTAGIEHEAAAEVGVGLEFLDVEAIGAPEGAPVEPPQIVAGNILSVLGEFDARPAMRTGMAPGDVSLHGPPRKQQGR